MLSFVLAERIASLFLIMAMGFAIVRIGKLDSKQVLPVSMISMYIISPCMIVTAFQVDMTPEVESGFLLALVAGAVVQIAYGGLAWFFGRICHFDAVEKVSVTYANAGNLIIPLVVSTLGSEWVIYCTAYLVLQTFLMWSHGRSVLQGKAGVDWRHILLGVNMLAVYVGIFLFVTGLRLPGPVYNAVDWVGSMIGPAAMLITGIIMAGLSLDRVLSYKRLWIPVVFRLVVFPLFACLFLKHSGIAALSPNGTEVLLITLLAAAAPSASTVNQMAQVFDNDAGYASAINVTTTLLCIITMPLMVALYQF